jgi:hypothetical protein
MAGKAHIFERAGDDFQRPFVLWGDARPADQLGGEKAWIHRAHAYAFLVAPAKAGVQGHVTERVPWIPAFAGMTSEKNIDIN